MPDGSEAVVIVSVAAAATPVPFSDTACGLAAALSVIEIEPVGVPAAVGVKVTEMVQLAPAATLVPQVLVSAKLDEAAILLIVRVAVPVFFKVTVWAALVVPTVWLAKVRLVGDKLTAGVLMEWGAVLAVVAAGVAVVAAGVAVVAVGVSEVEVGVADTVPEVSGYS
jgi:hypothetical protein